MRPTVLLTLLFLLPACGDRPASVGVPRADETPDEPDTTPHTDVVWSDTGIEPADSDATPDTDGSADDTDRPTDDSDDTDTPAASVWCPEDADGDGLGGAGLVELPAGTLCGVAPHTATTQDDCDDQNPIVGLPFLAYPDDDADGHGATSPSQAVCALPPAWVLSHDDCDDTDPLTHPGVVETIADGIDADCDGAELCWVDADGDGHGNPQATVLLPGTTCVGPGVAVADDCDDTTALVHPGSPEVPYDAIDQDCSGADMTDVDQDGFDGGPGGPDCHDLNPLIHPLAIDIAYDGIDQDCRDGDYADVDGDGYDGGPTGIDCHDLNATIHPEAPEIPYDAIDQDCDGTDLVDVDGDGHAGGPAGQDCNDSSPTIHPGATEVPYDAIDQDCDGLDLDDLDGDGAPGGPNGTDCDDTLATIHPGAEEVPYDGIDQDCADGDLIDVDGDGAPGGPNGTDCNDQTARRFPGNPEIPYDHIDQDCDGSDLVDVDGDGVDGGHWGTDCDDNDPATYPGAPEVPYDTLDQDCNGSDLVDVDGDGVPGGPTGDDCDDSEPSVHPGATEICNDGIDQDCDPTPRTCGLGGPADISSADTILAGPPGRGFGFALAGGVDLTGDGWPDLVVGDPNQSLPALGDRAGVVSVFSGPSLQGSTVSAGAARTRLYGGGREQLGRSLAATDVGPGAHRLYIGAPEDGPDAQPYGAIYRYASPLPVGDHWVGDQDDVMLGAVRDRNLGDRIAVGRPDPMQTDHLLATAPDSMEPDQAWWIHPGAWLFAPFDVAAMSYGTGMLATLVGTSDIVLMNVASGHNVFGGPGDESVFAWANAQGMGITIASDAPYTQGISPLTTPQPHVDIPLPTAAWGPDIQVLTVPDITGDGRADLVVSVPCTSLCSGGGDVWVLPGGPQLPTAVQHLTDVGTTQPGTHLHHDGTAAGFGHALAYGGDLNGDGFGDLVIGAITETVGGAFYVLYGPIAPGEHLAADIGGALPGAHVTSTIPGAFLGWTATSVGDIDGDGDDELAVSAPFLGLTNQYGRVYLWRGAGD